LGTIPRSDNAVGSNAAKDKRTVRRASNAIGQMASEAATSFGLQISAVVRNRCEMFSVKVNGFHQSNRWLRAITELMTPARAPMATTRPGGCGPTARYVEQ